MGVGTPYITVTECRLLLEKRSITLGKAAPSCWSQSPGNYSIMNFQQLTFLPVEKIGSCRGHLGGTSQHVLPFIRQVVDIDFEPISFFVLTHCLLRLWCIFSFHSPLTVIDWTFIICLLKYCDILLFPTHLCPLQSGFHTATMKILLKCKSSVCYSHLFSDTPLPIR